MGLEVLIKKKIHPQFFPIYYNPEIKRYLLKINGNSKKGSGAEGRWLGVEIKLEIFYTVGR